MRGLDDWLTHEPEMEGRPPRVVYCPCGRAALCSRDGCAEPGKFADHCGVCHDDMDNARRDEESR